ncbi:MAG: bifunctional DNA-formamidopyrimidine glycosylase/DNA-(apurinic or apyrimidinic site) lyase [Proteobacteria bacterium]|nr:bifunctional DNA-formamidopyrimidine glycosylase/DNA-(apurinic or apyrimidinic site) lyase [Pseudomonadota bacterium]NOG60637.1 bifunctional DNA-formamidopyrimidine glycosylase/DNA-(apurinic or apyrimidinic site) lyase [Pseudomonadota bacterium]
MPELPEVETTKKGIAPYVVGETVKDIIIRERNLRWPVPHTLKRSLKHHLIRKLKRRAKYLLFYTDSGCMILHLGMSGNLRVLDSTVPHEKHDHVDIIFESGHLLRFRDPRKFGSLLWTNEDPLEHKLINHLGPEPLSDEFNTEYLYARSRKRTQAIKTFIMDSRIVVGVGNIYASEALFRAGIKPSLQAGKISNACYAKLVNKIKTVLSEAIEKGGTTLRDFYNGEGKPGYFSQELNVYNREDEPCNKCNKKIKMIRLGQRSTFYCSYCQK